MRRLLPVLLAMSLCFQVSAFAQARNPAQISKNRIVKARPLPLSDVRLLGGPLKVAQELDADYIVKELKEIQEKQGDGYLGALMDKDGVDGKIHFEELCRGIIRSGGFDLNGLWSPWYVEHKIFAGLRDAYRYTGNREALEVEIKFAGWVESIVSKLDDEQIQKMLATEFGGMNEVTADLYADTGDPRWLKLSDKFEHREIIDPLASQQDILGGKHGNTQVPKLLGSLSRYIYTGDQTDHLAAAYFWDQVALH